MSSAAEGLALTVIVPSLNGRELLPVSLDALASSELARDRWELIVVDDGSTDDTFDIAGRWADRVFRVEDGPRGPAYARNRGAELATGDVLVFVDADVVVHEDTLRRIVEAFEEDPELGAIFGAYDDEPAHPSFLSQYRNLLHRHVHVRGAGEAETFWAGCGAIRTEAFRRVGGFDTKRFPRPQIEDIELGYRLRDAGHRIEIRPEIQAKHLKRWSFRDMVRTDFLDRALPWMLLILERDAQGHVAKTLNVSPLEKIKTALVGMAILLAALGVAFRDPGWAVAAGAALLTVMLLNWPTYRWFGELRGWSFALRVIPFHLLYHFLSGLAVVVGWGLRLVASEGSGDPPSSPRSTPLGSPPVEAGDSER